MDAYSAAAVIDVIGKSTDGVKNWLWIPIRLVFYSCVFNGTLIKQIRNINW